MSSPDPRAVRGAVAPSRLIAIVVILVLLIAVGAWWYLKRTSGSAILPTATTTPGAPAPGDASPASAPVVSDELTVDQLYREARKAMNENRMAAPAGNNALEYYLKIVAKQPDDSGAKDALRELFPFATGAAEDQINQNQFDEANRIITALATADPNNYSLTILRSKLDAKKKQADREQQQAQTAAAAAAQRPNAAAAAAAASTTAPAATPGATPTTAAPTAATDAAASAPPPAATPAAAPPVQTASVTPPRPAATPTPAPPPAAEPAGPTRDATATSPPVPIYPIAAARNRQEGWVEVEFTVSPEGSVGNAHVVGSQPPRIFDREAIAAVQRAKFEPRLQNGAAVASTLRRRIEFKLGN